MTSAILQFVLFIAIAGGIGYFIWKKSSIKQDLHDDFGI